MRKALESLGWECSNVGSAIRRCNKCSTYSTENMWHKFCTACGAQLPKYDSTQSTSSQLEASIAYALGETKKLPGSL